MRRALRWAAGIFCTLSLLLLLAVAPLWARGGGHQRNLLLVLGSTRLVIGSGGGEAWFAAFGPEGMHVQQPGIDGYWDERLILPGIELGLAHEADPVGGSWLLWQGAYVRAPCLLLILLLIVPGIFVPVARLQRARSQVQPGLCPACGYDLRATPEGGAALLPRCPECGRKSPAAANRDSHEHAGHRAVS